MQSQLPEQLILQIGRLRSTLSDIQQQYDNDGQPYADFMKAHNLAKADATTVALRSLDNMYAYSRGREDRIRQAILLLSGDIVRRVDALIIAQAASQPGLLQAAQLRASTRFLKDIDGRLQLIWKDPPMSTVLQLTYLAAQ